MQLNGLSCVRVLCWNSLSLKLPKLFSNLGQENCFTLLPILSCMLWFLDTAKCLPNCALGCVSSLSCT
uniref:Uncharacterized protein n=1 Tax=Anguilla anguilla TaxID=7936 RepID=A0A0E9WLI8_ANGAN